MLYICPAIWKVFVILNSIKYKRHFQFYWHPLRDREIRLKMLQVMQKMKYYRCKALRTVAKQWETWMVQIKKSKAIYHTMNMFTLDITRKCLIGQCWIPDSDLPAVEDMMDRVSVIIIVYLYYKSRFKVL